MAQTGGTQPAGWLPDPTGRFHVRYWDGVRWTEHVATSGRAATDPLTQPLASPGGTTGGRAVRTSSQRAVPLFQRKVSLPVWALSAIGLGVRLLVGAVGAGASNDGQEDFERREQELESLRVELANQRKELQAALRATSTTSASTTTTTVRVTITVAPTTRPGAPAATARPAPPPPAPPAVNQPSCHPSYSGACLPPDASDVDCGGGSGNGPVYTEATNFGVVGPDEYDLDRDGNGLACES